MLNSLVTVALPLIPKKIVEKVAKPYIAGENLSNTIEVVRKLNYSGATATLDILGEDVTSKEDSQKATNDCLSILDAIAKEKINSNLSLKLTHLGLKLDYSICEENLKSIIDSAKEKNIFVRIDMEDHTCTDETIKLFRAMRNRHEKVGVVIQAYLKRSEKDIRALVSEKTNLRLCKGIYNERAEIAFKNRKEIQNNFLKLLEIIFDGKSFVGIATHDDVLIDGAKKIIAKKNISKDEFEFQMLLGVRKEKRDLLIAEGNHLRVYAPFGKDWYPYSIRRLKENPRMAFYIAKAFLGFEN